jgi:hypothetical protein
MSLRQLYQWRDEIARELKVGAWLGLGLAMFSMGVVLAERSTLSKVAERLWLLGKPESVERRLQRVLSNQRLNMEGVSVAWVKWVLKNFVGDELVFLVDETKLGKHLSVMMVGLAYQHRCLPLVWRCYTPGKYPAEGQVKLIEGLLQRIAAVLPREVIPLLQADRGIGTSPDLVRCVDALGWQYLFRVQGQTRFRDPADPQSESALDSLVKQGQSFSAHGEVFKGDGWLEAWAHVLWESTYDEPWCLITHAEPLSARLYAQRNWQEQSFRDLKGGGWQWQRSQVWRPDHAERLLLVLALAYAWVLSLGTLVAHAEPATRRLITRGSQRRYSFFREGLRYLHSLFHFQQPVCLRLFFVSDKPTFPNLS